jgi:hypothetical protein
MNMENYQKMEEIYDQYNPQRAVINGTEVTE